MKKIIFILGLFVSFVANAQKTTGSNYTYFNTRSEWFTGIFQALGLPSGSGPAAFKSGQDMRAGAVYYDSTGSDAGFYIYTGTAWVLQGSPAAVELPNELISGGQVTYSGTGLKFYVSPAVYRISGVIYGTTYDSVTLSPSDPDDPRKDVIFLATTGVEVETGTPAGPAAEPQLDADEIKLTVIDVPATATTPGIITNIIWDENTESVVTNLGTTTDPNDLSNPYHLTKAIKVTNFGNSDQVIITLPSTINATSYDGITLFLKAETAIPAGTTIRMIFYNGSTRVSSEVIMAITASQLTYQGISLPMSRFSFNNSFFDKIVIRYVGNTVWAGGYFDYIFMQSGLVQGGGSGTPLTIGPIDGKTSVPNGAVIENNIFYNQTASQSNPGLMSAADKAKLDSMYSDYFIIPVGGQEELVTQPNDSTVGIKTLKDSTGIGIIDRGNYLSVYNTGVTSTPTLQQVLTAGSSLTGPHGIAGDNDFSLDFPSLSLLSTGGTVFLDNTEMLAGKTFRLGGISSDPGGVSAGTTYFNTTTGKVRVYDGSTWSDLGGDANLIVQNAGSGIQSWFTSGDTLYKKKFKNTSTISWATDTDSSMLGTVIDASITYAKIQNVTQARLLGRYTASTGSTQEITIGSGLTLNSSTGELTASGSGSNNANAGAFYRWLKPSSQEIKTFAAGYGFLIDSTTNTDALTARIDTSVISTRWYRDKLADSLGAIIDGIPAGETVKTMYLSSPTTSDNITYYFTDSAITVTKLADVLTGTSPSVTYNVFFASTRNSGTPDSLFSSPRVSTSITGATTTTFNDNTIPAGSWIWLKTYATSGTINDISVNLLYPGGGGSGGGGGGTWGSIAGTLSSQTDLQSALDAKAPTASPTFTGTITTPLTANRAVAANGSSQLAASATTDTELGYLSGATSNIQAQLDKEIGIIQNTTYTLTSTTSVQKLFDAVTNGEITVEANTTYQFDCVFALSSMSATNGNCGFDVLGAGTATFTSVNWIANTRDAVFNGAAAASNIYSNAAAVTGNIAQASTATEFYAHIKGTIRVNAGGTIIPSVNLTTAAAAVVQVNSYFKLYPIGSGSVTSW